MRLVLWLSLALFACFAWGDFGPAAADQRGKAVAERAEAQTKQGGNNQRPGAACSKVGSGNNQQASNPCLTGSSSGVARADYNGDGFADLAIGVPGEETPAGRFNAGAVIVIYGSPGGLTATAAGVPAPQFWSQNSPGVPEASESFDLFGSALAGGDFNDDGFSDLAIGVPGEDRESGFDTGDTGTVIIISGSANGLTATNTSVPRPKFFHVQNFSTFFFFEGDGFGSALAWGDFDADGVGDLAIGAPRFVGGSPAEPSDGAVFVMFGTRATGLSLARHQVWEQNSAGIPGSGVDGDLFGQALAGGDFNNDGATDLAIGIPGKEVAGDDTQDDIIVDAGKALVLFGRRNVGLTAANDRLFDATNLFRLSRPGNVALAGDALGAALAAGDFDGDRRDDLAIGVPRRDTRRRADSGAVFVIHSTRGGLIGTTQFWEQTALFGPDVFNANGSPTETGDAFGFALAAGDFNADRRDDLAVGAPLEDVLVNRGSGRFDNVIDAGEVNIIYGAPEGLATSPRRPQQWHQDTINIEDRAERNDQFGISLSAWNFGRNETRRVCTPVPPRCFNVPAPTADLAIGTPLEDVGSVADAGAVNVLYGSIPANGLSFSNDQLWTQNSPGIPGAAQGNDRFGSALY